MKNAAMNSGNASWKECGSHFQNEKFSDALIEAIKEIGSVLARHFPKNGRADTNELPDDVIESLRMIRVCKIADLDFIPSSAASF